MVYAIDILTIIIYNYFVPKYWYTYVAVAIFSICGNKEEGMNGSKMYLDGDTYRERIPKPIKTIIIVFHVLAIFLLVGALIYSINIGILSKPSTLRPIWFTSVAIIFYIVASATLDAGFNRYKDKALIATVVMLWFSIIFCGLNFIPHVNPYIYNYIIIPVIVAIVGAGLMFIESLFVFVAFGCATERKRKYLYEQRLREKQKQPKDFVPGSLKAMTITFFSLMLVLVFVTVIIAFVSSDIYGTITIYEKYRNSAYPIQNLNLFLGNNILPGMSLLSALVMLFTGLITYCVGCKRNNTTLGITILPLLSALMIIVCLCGRFYISGESDVFQLYGNNYHCSIRSYYGNSLLVIMSFVSLGLLVLTYFFVLISIFIAASEQKKIGKQGSAKQTKVVVQGFDYNRQNWWD